MARWRPPEWQAVLPMLAWLAALALLPWWLGLPLLLALAAALLLQLHWPVEHATLLRRALRWGLPGVMFALQRALGGGPFGLGAALLGALAGYTLLAGLEAWLDRDQRRAPAGTTTDAEWPELARAPVGPPARIIELRPPEWHAASPELADPRGDALRWREGSYQFADGTQVQGGEHFDFIFSDVSMPNGVSGIDLAAHSARLQPEARVILASGYARAQLPPLPDNVTFLPKPYRLPQLLGVLECAFAPVR